MPVELKIPEAGESVSEVQIAEWRKAEGDHVEQDEPIVDVETDKAGMELPAPATGTLSRIVKQAGETVNVGDVIAVITEAGDAETAEGDEGRRATDESKEQPQRDQKQKPTRDRRREEPEAAEEREPPEKTQKEQPERQTAAKKRDREDRRQPADRGAGRRPRDAGRTERDDGDTHEPEKVEVQPRVMPAAMRALAEHQLHPSEVKGSGPGGRVLKEDVLRHVRKAPAEEERPRPKDRAAVRRPEGDRQEERVPMTMLRRRIAERLVEAQQQAALLTTFNEIDMGAVLELRKTHGELFQERYGVRIGLMSFFVKAAIEALKRFPQVNAEVQDTEIVYKNYYDIGVAVATEQGLVVPVLRDADQMSFAQIEQAIGDLAERARERKLAVEELQGGTFTITNGGVFGSLLSTPIINPPQSGILGMHTIQERPVAREGQVVIRPMMYVALTYDHRIVDGREAVLFLRHVRDCIEAPARILMEV